MTVPIAYPDTVKFVETVPSAYGDETYVDEQVVAAIFGQVTGWRHANNQDATSGDASVFVDPSNTWVQSKGSRLEGMLLLAGPMGPTDWYRVTNVVVSRDAQFTNVIDNIELTLKKSGGLKGVG